MTSAGYALVDFLPQEKNTQLLGLPLVVTFLKNLCFFTQQMMKTLGVLKEGKWSAFDPHVGDTACQTRAFLNLLLSKKVCDVELATLTTQVSSLQEKLKHLILDYSKRQAYHRLTPRELIEQEDLDLLIPEHIYYFALSLFLSVEIEYVANTNKTAVIDYVKTGNKIGVSKSFAKRLCRHLQRAITEYSCEILQKHDNNIQIKQDSLERFVVPTFQGAKTLLKMALEEGFLFVVRVQKDNNPFHILAYQREQGTERIKLLGLQESVSFIVANQPAVEVVAEVQGGEFDYGAWLKKIYQYSFEDLFLFNMAAHPQYSCPSLRESEANLYANVPVVLKQYKECFERAHQDGFSLDNPSMLLMKHVSSKGIDAETCQLLENMMGFDQLKVA